MFGHECANCGMLEWACVCVPWCFKHNRRDYDPRCTACAEEHRAEAERRAALKSFTLPWYVALWRFLAG